MVLEVSNVVQWECDILVCVFCLSDCYYYQFGYEFGVFEFGFIGWCVLVYFDDLDEVLCCFDFVLQFDGQVYIVEYWM